MGDPLTRRDVIAEKRQAIPVTSEALFWRHQPAQNPSRVPTRPQRNDPSRSSMASRAAANGRDKSACRYGRRHPRGVSV